MSGKRRISPLKRQHCPIRNANDEMDLLVNIAHSWKFPSQNVTHETNFFSPLGASERQPTITSSQSVVIANESSDVRLTCIGQNTAQVKTAMFWKFGGRRIRNGSNRKISWERVEKDKVNFTLEIKNVTQKDVGEYRCKLRLRDSRKTQAMDGKIKLQVLGFDDGRVKCSGRN